MAQKPKPVPWPEVVDLSDDLFEWLVAKKHAKAKDTRIVAAVRVLSAIGITDSVPSQVAQALREVEFFRGAGRREDFLAQRSGREAMTAAEAVLRYDDSVERAGDKAIRGLPKTFGHVRSLVRKVSERTEKRIASLPHAGRLVKRAKEDAQTKLATVLEDLGELACWAAKLQEDYDSFNPAATRQPLTLGGWKKLEREIRKKMTKLGVRLG